MDLGYGTLSFSDLYPELYKSASAVASTSRGCGVSIDPKGAKDATHLISSVGLAYQS